MSYSIISNLLSVDSTRIMEILNSISISSITGYTPAGFVYRSIELIDGSTIIVVTIADDDYEFYSSDQWSNVIRQEEQVMAWAPCS